VNSFDDQTQSAIKISLEEEKLRETHQRNEFLRIQDDFQNQEKQNNQPGDSKREVGPSVPMRPPVN